MSEHPYKFSIPGFLFFLSGCLILMGIITGEIYYPLEFTTRDNYISELAAALPPKTIVPQPSATIFNVSMIVSGIMILSGTVFLQIRSGKLLSTIPIGLFGIGMMGVGLCPGNVAPWHGVFAMILFIAGAVAAITSFKIVHGALRYAFIVLGVVSLTFLIAYDAFVPAMGVGGTERWAFYPLVLWLTGLGGYLQGIIEPYNPSS